MENDNIPVESEIGEITFMKPKTHIRFKWTEPNIDYETKYKCNKGHITDVLFLDYTNRNGENKKFCDVCFMEVIKKLGIDIAECEEIEG